MRAAILLASAALFVCAAAFAQTTTPPAPATDATGRFTGGRFDRTPTGQSWAHFYPNAAVQQNTSGVALMCCTPKADRTLDCRVGAEWPQGLGFGAAAQELSQEFQMSEASHAAYQSQGATWLAIPMRFVLEPKPAGFDEAATRVISTAADACAPGH